MAACQLCERNNCEKSNFCLHFLSWGVNTSLLRRDDKAFYQGWISKSAGWCPLWPSQEMLILQLAWEASSFSVLCMLSLCCSKKEGYWNGIGSLKSYCDFCTSCTDKTAGVFLCYQISISDEGYFIMRRSEHRW